MKIKSFFYLSVFAGTAFALTACCAGNRSECNNENSKCSQKQKCSKQDSCENKMNCPHNNADALLKTDTNSAAMDGKAVFSGKGMCWELDLTSIALPAGNANEKPPLPITLTVDSNGRFFGCAGINRYNGTAAVDAAKKTIVFGDKTARTMMMGPGMAYEDAYMQLLSKADRYELNSKGELILFKGATRLGVFKQIKEDKIKD